MATIEFKAKVRPLGVFSNEPPYAETTLQTVAVPELTKNHCDMGAFRKHPKYGGFANSTLFPAILSRIARDVAPKGYLRLDALPANVTVDVGGFLAIVRIEV
jgi:hypothetical protein